MPRGVNTIAISRAPLAASRANRTTERPPQLLAGSRSAREYL